MKKQLFLSVMVLALSAEMFAPALGKRGAQPTPPAPSRGGQPTPPPSQGGSQPTPPTPSSSAAQVAQGLSAEDAIASAASALGVELPSDFPGEVKPDVVNFIQR